MLDVLLLDSRDSFTWNLAQAFEELSASVEVAPAFEVTTAHVLAARPRLVCIGPGPRGPADLPALVTLAREVSARLPTFGVCLGLQALVLAHGGTVGRASTPVHGKRSPIVHDQGGLFAGLPSPLWVMRYHSLVATRAPSGFAVTAQDEAGQPMALHRHAGPFCAAVQFHPESVGTAGGLEILRAVLLEAGAAAGPVRHRPGGIPPPSRAGPRVSLEDPSPRAP